jgi:hypothetical protein
MPEQKKGELPLQTIGYGDKHKIRISIPYPIRNGVCDPCGLSVTMGEIKVTQIHHWVYAYKNETVQKNPLLVLENTVEVCFPCHQIADGLRMILTYNPERAVKVAMLMEKWEKTKPLLRRLEEFCILFLRKRGFKI